MAAKKDSLALPNRGTEYNGKGREGGQTDAAKALRDDATPMVKGRKSLEPEEPDEPEDIDDVMLGSDEDRTEMDKVLEIICDPTKIGYFTQMNNRERIAFSALGTIAVKYPELDMLRRFLARDLEYRVSTNRKGREELVKIVGRQLAMTEESNQPVHGWRRFLGGRR